MYRDILRDVMEPYSFESMPVNYIFQHDIDPKHASKLVKKWFDTEKIAVLKWPAQSPDLNPIENLWEHLDRKVHELGPIKNANEMFEKLTEAWNAIDRRTIENLKQSMTRRMQAVLNAKGCHTKY